MSDIIISQCLRTATTMDMQISQEKPTFIQKLIQNLKNYLIECRRVLTVTKKPTNIEFKTIVKVSSLGILLIGAIGFLVQLIEQMLLK